MSSHTCPRCGAVTDPVLPGGLCVTCHGRRDDTRQSPSVVADAPTPSFDPDAAGTLTFATPADSTVAHGETGADPFGVLPAGGYVYGEVLGTGGMGCVYKAVRVSTGQTVAIKKLRPERYTPSLLRRFVQEARILARVEHPNVVRLHDFVPDPGDPHIVMDFVDGCSLADRLADGKVLPPGEAARLVADAARGVAAAHAAGGIHRDLKPGNLLVTKADQIKVSDFGLGKVMADDGSPTLTMTDTPIGGTPGYAAPEQVAEGGVCDERTDVWGLGACLHACLVGRPPYPSGRANLTRVLSDPLVPPRAVNRAVPAVLDAIVCKCLEKDPAHRYQTASDVAADLDRYRRGESTVAKPLTRAARAWRRARLIPRAAVIAATVAAVLTAGIATVILLPRREPTTIQPLVTGGESKEDVLAAMKAELEAGRPVTLVAEKGLPRWSEWVVGKADIGHLPNGDGAASITPNEQGAVLLLPRTSGRYCLQAELRHTSAANLNNFAATQVGLLFAHQSTRSPTGAVVQSFLSVEFSDYDREWLTGQPPATRPVEVRSHHFHFPQPGAKHFQSKASIGGETIAFVPSRLLPGRWRQVTVDVSPTGLKVLWRSDPSDETSEPVEVVAQTADQINAELALQQRGLKLSPRVPNIAPDVPTVWRPDGGVGVWSSNSGLEFRNVTMRPVQPE